MFDLFAAEEIFAFAFFEGVADEFDRIISVGDEDVFEGLDTALCFLDFTGQARERHAGLSIFEEQGKDFGEGIRGRLE